MQIYRAGPPTGCGPRRPERSISQALRSSGTKLSAATGDYERQPAFSGGAWRFVAVHLSSSSRRTRTMNLGCGGLIAEACAEGRPVRAIVVSDGTGSHPSSKAYLKARLRDLREDEAREAIKVLGIDSDKDIVFLRLPDWRRPLCREGGGPDRRIRPGGGGGRPLCELAPRRALRSPSVLSPCARGPTPADRGEALRVHDLGYDPSAATPVEPAGDFRLEIGRHLARKRRAIDPHRSQTTDLIADDPKGFRLAVTDLARFAWPMNPFSRAREMERAIQTVEPAYFDGIYATTRVRFERL